LSKDLNGNATRARRADLIPSRDDVFGEAHDVRGEPFRLFPVERVPGISVHHELGSCYSHDETLLLRSSPPPSGSQASIKREW